MAGRIEAGESPARRGGEGEGEGKKEDGRVSRFVFTRGENPSLSLSPFAIVVGGGQSRSSSSTWKVEMLMLMHVANPRV